MLELYGRGYVVDHVIASFQREQEEEFYRMYVTDCLRILTENTTHYVIAGYGNVDYGAHIKERWAEMRKKVEPKEEKSGDEIAADIIARAGLMLGEGE